MLATLRGVPPSLLILLGPMLFAVGQATAESQGEETAEFLRPAAAAIIRIVLSVEKRTPNQLTSTQVEDERAGKTNKTPPKKNNTKAQTLCFRAVLGWTICLAGRLVRTEGRLVENPC